tara:strand:+ start:1059 stop:2108 length:1050 start_codon:yes stop_codon:yes gene_type:complete
MAIIAYGTGVTGPAADTELGLPIIGNGFNIEQVPNKSTVGSITLTAAGTGYSLSPGGLPKQGIICSSVSNGAGTGAVFQITSADISGNMTVGSLAQPTAGFNSYQNTLLDNLNVANAQYTYIRDTATGLSSVSGTTTAVAGTSAAGINGTFLVTVASGMVTNVTVAVAGSGYKPGDIVTITVANLQAPMNVVNGGAVVILGNLQILLTEDNITGGVSAAFDAAGNLLGSNANITILEGGSGHAAGDVLTLQEIGSSVIGTATVSIATINPGAIQISGQLRYPVGLMVGTFGLDGSTAVKTGSIELKQLDGTQVIITGLTTGKILPIMFSEITAAGTANLLIADTTIFYK